ncbi:MAG TPA: hypothetical protein VK424_03140 [Thermoplasmata archaeon]|nr:hypothetical protein [Thermoplasmata archaeon]
MPRHRVEALLGLARQGLEIAAEFGTHSIEAMIWVALTVEASVYQPGSFVRTPTGVRFILANPPLRTGAFAACRVGVDGRAPTATGVRFRASPGEGAWSSADEVSEDRPLHFRPGDPVEFEAECTDDGRSGPRTVRLELECPAIPPLVWFEFTDTPRRTGTEP